MLGANPKIVRGDAALRINGENLRRILTAGDDLPRPRTIAQRISRYGEQTFDHTNPNVAEEAGNSGGIYPPNIAHRGGDNEVATEDAGAINVELSTEKPTLTRQRHPRILDVGSVRRNPHDNACHARTGEHFSHREPALALSVTFIPCSGDIDL